MAVPTGAALVYVGADHSDLRSHIDNQPQRGGQRGASNVTDADPISSTQTITVDNEPTATSVNDMVEHDGLTGSQPGFCYGIKYHPGTTPPPAPG